MLPALSMNGKTQGQDQGEVLREEKQKDFLDYHQHKRRKGSPTGNNTGGQGRHLPGESPPPAPCESLKDLEVVAGSFEGSWKGFKVLTSGREKEKYKVLYGTVRNVTRLQRLIWVKEK